MRPDLKKHILAGIVIAVAVALAIAFTLLKFTTLHPGFIVGLCPLAGYCAADRAGWAKEYWYDAKRTDKHTVDYLDYAYTRKGGLIGALLAMLFLAVMTAATHT